MIRHTVLRMGLLTLILAASPASGAPNGPKVPVALAWGPEGRLYVALRDGRGVSAIDPRTWTVVGRWDLPAHLADLAWASDRALFYVGSEDGRFLTLDARGRVVQDLAVGRGPVRVLPLPEGRAAVAPLWDEAVTIVDASAGRVVATHPLPFAPGALVRAPDGRVIVADAFGGKVADLMPGRLREASRVRHSA